MDREALPALQESSAKLNLSSLKNFRSRKHVSFFILSRNRWFFRESFRKKIFHARGPVFCAENYTSTGCPLFEKVAFPPKTNYRPKTNFHPISCSKLWGFWQELFFSSFFIYQIVIEFFLPTSLRREINVIYTDSVRPFCHNMISYLCDERKILRKEKYQHFMF